MAAPLVAVLLGTDHHPFDRLVGWVAELSRTGELDWYVQHGHTKLPPGLRGSSMLGAPALAELLGRAGAVITHGGPGLIMEAREAGHVPIVVPRDPRQHEHIDDHQQRFAEHLANVGLAVVAHDLLELRLALLPALTGNRAGRGIPHPRQDPSEAFGDLVADVLAGSMTVHREDGS